MGFEEDVERFMRDLSAPAFLGRGPGSGPGPTPRPGWHQSLVRNLRAAEVGRVFLFAADGTFPDRTRFGKPLVVEHHRAVGHGWIIGYPALDASVMHYMAITEADAFAGRWCDGYNRRAVKAAPGVEAQPKTVIDGIPLGGAWVADGPPGGDYERAAAMAVALLRTGRGLTAHQHGAWVARTT